MYNQLVGGGKLSADVRNQFIGQAENVYRRAKQDADQVVKQYRVIAEKSGINPDDIDINRASSAEKSADAKPAQGGYIIGRKYGDLTYLGGDPANEGSWKK